MAVTYTNSAAVGAISIYGVNGRLKTWADKHLVTDHAYTCPYSSTNAGFYMPPGSTGPGFLLNHDSASSGSAARAVFRAAESASGISTLVDPFPTVALCGDTACTMLASSTADSTPRAWWALIGDFTGLTDSFFLLVVQISATQTEWHFFGRPFLQNPADTYGWLISIRNAAANGSVSYNITTNNGVTACQKMYWMRSTDGTIKSTTSVVIGAYGGGGSGLLGLLTNTSAYPPPIGSKLDYTPIQVGCSGSTSNATATPKNNHKRAILPYLFAPSHTSYTGVTNADTFLDASYDAAASFLLFGATFSASTLTNGAIAMQTAGPFHPMGFV